MSASRGDAERPERVPGQPEAAAPAPARASGSASAKQRKQVLLRLDPLVYEALARWAGDELRSANAQIEFLLRRALGEAGRLPRGAAPIRRRGRPAGGGSLEPGGSEE